MKNGFSRKFGRGSLTVGLSAVVLAAVIFLNILFGIFCNDNRWFIDLTSGRFREKDLATYAGMYTLTDSATTMLSQTFEAVDATRPEGDKVKVDIVFCADPDILCKNEQMRYIYYTALEMQKAFPDHIQVSTTDVWTNPSSVNAYMTNSYSRIYPSNVIVSSGSEFRVYTLRSFFTYSETTDADPWAYSGEKTFLKGIIAVTKADAPIACLTTNHGEVFSNEEGKAEYSAFIKVLNNAGYEVRFLNLKEEEIPENCRLIVTLDPQTDFFSDFKDQNAVSEISKLDKYLAKAYSFMIFVDADTPKLPHLEEFLVEWGISLNRYEVTDEAENTALINGVLADRSNALDGDGLIFNGVYETEALGGSITEDMRKYGQQPPRIVFSNAVGISYSESYESAYELADATAGTGAFTYGYYNANKSTRKIYDIFRTSETAVTYAKQNGEAMTESDALDTVGNFKLLTITQESRLIGEGQGYTNINDASYVCAVGSTEFASNKMLAKEAEKEYGNTDLLLAVLRVIGREVEPVGIKFKPLYSAKAAEAQLLVANPQMQTTVLTLIPALVFAISGTVILVRRKFRK